jgi:uncharacterized protein YsxB (DUF464 family)
LKKSSSSKAGLTISIRRSAGRIVAITVSGHAGYAARGRDIVCAAASALVLSAAHGIATHCKSPTTVVDDGDGDYRLTIPRGGNASAQVVLESAVSGLRAISRSYPGSLRVRSVTGKPAVLPKRSGPTRAARN